MSRLLARIVSTIVVLLFAAAAMAVDLDFTYGTDTQYNSNVFRTESGSEDDFSFRFFDTGGHP